MKIFSWYKIPINVRRFIGITILFILGYWTVSFGIKLIFYILYAGTSLMDVFFKFLCEKLKS